MDTLDSIIAAQSWDNWQDEGTGEPWDICQVLHCKLDWLKEQLDPNSDEDAEHIDTIGYVQDLLGMLDENKLRSVCH